MGKKKRQGLDGIVQPADPWYARILFLALLGILFLAGVELYG